jgi:hypothetical protein
MKNIHILQTDKPSILIKDIWKNTFSLVEDFDTNHTDFKAQNIYITSNEEIKEGDWCLFESNNTLKKAVDSTFAIGVNNIRIHADADKKVLKIILTTDGDLIKDGVQAIDDDFLEWFVNNPSCEFVKVKKECCGQCDERLCEVNDLGRKETKENTFYKIIIPGSHQDETERLLSTEANKKRLLGDIKQAEKSDKKYSEEEVFDLLMEFSSRDINSSSRTPHSIAKWFEQFKK